MTYATFKERYAFWGLLLSFAASFLVTPFYDHSTQPLNVFLLSSTVFAVITTSHSKGSFILVASFGVMTLVSIIGYGLHLYVMADLVFYCIAMLFYLYIVESLLTGIFRSRTVTTNTLLSAVSIYFAFAVIWAMIYGLILYFDAAAFAIPKTMEGGDTIHTLMYFSVVTLTTLGYGDITPLSNSAKAFTAMQSLVGQIYLTVLVARLVGLHIAENTV